MPPKTAIQGSIMRTQEDKAFYVQMGKRIAEARTKAGLTQAIVSEQLGIGTQTYAHYESARLRTPVWHLRRIAEILDLPYDALIDGAPVDTSRSKRGPRSTMETMFLKVAELPKPKQKMIQEFVEAMLQKEAS